MRQWSIFQRAQRGSCWVSLLPWDGCFADCSSCLLVPQIHPFFASPSLPSCCCCFPYPPRQGPRLKEGGSLVHSMLWQYGGQLSWVSLQDTSYPGTECALAWRMQSMGGAHLPWVGEVGLWEGEIGIFASSPRSSVQWLAGGEPNSLLVVH